MTNAIFHKRGFTLIELLVVISVIGLLSSVILSSLNSARAKSKTTVAKQQMATIVKGTVIAQGEANKTLMSITGSGCTDCSCRASNGYTPQSPGCYTATFTAFTNIQNATNGIFGNMTAMIRDPWGNPYLLDENQGEGGNCSSIDGLRSAGPDGVDATSDDIGSPIAIPLAPKCP